MNKLDGFHSYQNNLMSQMFSTDKVGKRDNLVGFSRPAPKKQVDEEKSKASDEVKLDKKTKVAAGIELSDSAKKLLDELKEKYSNMDIMVANYSTDEEAQKIMSKGNKDYSVLIEPDLLEKMAADEEVKNKYMGIIDESTQKLDDMKEELKDSGQQINRIGFTVGEDGSVSYFAELEKASKQRSQQIQADLKEKRAQEKAKAKEEEKKAQEEKLKNTDKSDEVSGYSKYQKSNSVKRTTVTAQSVEELLEKIKNVDWDSISTSPQQNTGARVDFSV